MFETRVKRALFVALLLTAPAAYARAPGDMDMSGMQDMSGMPGMDHDRMKMDAKMKGMKMKGPSGDCMKMKGMDMLKGQPMSSPDPKMKCGGKGDGMKMPMGPRGMPDAVHDR
ncbi:hypothetical protein AA13595_0475 [Gluconacetobacter johannae DSM 13595]|uniref:Pentapeptide MXKDX repeat protein n=1 Tax=Gluconacetobacter johannae TaxID=112140 RepID=A0A7W4J6B8_9PROT|nr:hypothetical protein [Gluconacetobacter johannae]MBB2175283.1 hypothetical protein [Gluconacetobacter johannae]GBQ80940.1 hypothetical protein AA13595_0475 [Gluconacetobacter johannae DSM 13595]